jgi:hypothetical protein
MAFNRFKYWFDEPSGELWDALHRPDKMDEFLITASIVPEILGVGYGSPKKQYDLYTKSTQYVKQESPAIDWGNEHEKDAIIAFYQRFPGFVGVKPGILFHADYPTVPLATSLDSIIWNARYPEHLINLECKCPFYNNFKLPSTVNDVSLKHIVQCQTQMLISGIRDSILWFWSPHGTKGFHIKYNKKAEKLIIKAIKEFENMVKDKLPYPRGHFKTKYAAQCEQLRDTVSLLSI